MRPVTDEVGIVRSPRTIRYAALVRRTVVTAGAVLLGLGLVVPGARADERPPVETESPGGALCLPGGPSTGCAPEQPAPPRTKSPQPKRTTTHAPPTRALPTRGADKPPVTAPSGPAKAAPTKPGASATSTRRSTTHAVPRQADPRRGKTAKAATAAAPTTPATAVGQRRDGSMSAVGYDAPVDAAAGPASTDPAWVGPAVTGLLLALVAVLVLGPLRRRAGRHR